MMGQQVSVTQQHLTIRMHEKGMFDSTCFFSFLAVEPLTRTTQIHAHVHDNIQQLTTQTDHSSHTKEAIYHVGWFPPLLGVSERCFFELQAKRTLQQN
jgi:hypothetical protein